MYCVLPHSVGNRCCLCITAPAARLLGFHPAKVLPCVLDVGTNNEALRDDPLYPGLDQPRVTGPAYYELVDEVRWA